MGGLAWFKFYAVDWRKDLKLQLCSLAARGLLIEMMALSHSECDPYGHLKIEESALTSADLAALTGRPKREVSRAWQELLDRRVVLVDPDSGCVFVPRLVKDEAKRLKAKEDGAQGGNPRLKVNPVVNPDLNQDPNPHARTRTSVSVSVSKDKKRKSDDQVQRVWVSHLNARAIYFEDKNGSRPSREPDLTPTVRKMILEAIKVHGLEKAQDAGRGIFLSDFHVGKNDERKEHLGPHLPWRINKTGDNVERFSELAAAARGET